MWMCTVTYQQDQYIGCKVSNFYNILTEKTTKICSRLPAFGIRHENVLILELLDSPSYNDWLSRRWGSFLELPRNLSNLGYDVKVRNWI